MSKQSIHASDEAWEDRRLGCDENFVKVVDNVQEDDLAEASGTQMISIRIQKSLIEDFKMIASLNGNIGYQTLMKQIMQRFVDSEKKQIFNDLVKEKLKSQQKLTEPSVKKTHSEKSCKIA
jgi:predicted DNA binding CopG/RHH family protein